MSCMQGRQWAGNAAVHADHLDPIWIGETEDLTLIQLQVAHRKGADDR